MNRYRINIKKNYVFDLNGTDKENVEKQVNEVMNESHILDLPYVNKKVKIKIRRIRKRINNEKSN